LDFPFSHLGQFFKIFFEAMVFLHDKNIEKGKEKKKKNDC
jgi:hypothetical protein